MSMFTVKGWLQLPLALVLRIPFALISFVMLQIARGATYIARKSRYFMNKMPSAEWNPKYLREQARKNREELIRNYTNG